MGGEIIPPLPPGGHRCGWEIPWHIGVMKGEDTGENGTGDARGGGGGGGEHLPQPAHIHAHTCTHMTCTNSYIHNLIKTGK